MKRILASWLFLFSCCLVIASTVYAGEMTPTGFYYPLKNDHSQYSNCGKWLGRPSPNGCYDYANPEGNPVYHIGIDMMASQNAPVYAIADGHVVSVILNGWTSGSTINVAIFVEHYLADGRTFTALYGHIKKDGAKTTGDVKAGDKIGEIGDWNGSGDHLHFGVITPGRLLPPNGNSLGRWKDNLYGIKDDEYHLYDNGFIDPIWFISHNGPDNKETRKDTSIPDVITSANPWFSEYCVKNIDTARCNMDDILIYIECVYEGSTLCTWDNASAWSGIGSGGYSSGLTKNAGGDVGFSNLPLPNLQIQKFQVFNRDKLLTEEKSFLEPAKKYQVNVWPVSEKENCQNGIEEGKDTVETDTFFKISIDEDEGEWRFQERSYTQCKNLVKEDSKKETFSFTVPEEAIGKRIYFKSKVDSTGEVIETDEHDNWSDKEWYPVLGNCDLTISYARLTKGRTVLQKGESYGIEMAVLNNGPDFCPMDIRSAYLHRKPNSSVWEVIASDDTKAVHLVPIKEHPELTKDEPFTADIVGFHDIMVCADNKESQSETNEGNNCFQFSFEVVDNQTITGPDYTISDIYLSDHQIVFELGDHFGIHMTVANIGNAPAPDDIVSGYYLIYPNTENLVYFTDDTTKKEQLCANCSHKEYTHDKPIEADQLGFWKAIACASYKYEKKELDYANNCREIRFEVTAEAVKLPDYITADASLTRGKTSLKLGEKFGIRGESSNIGNADSKEDTRLGYYTMRPGSGEWKLRDSDKVTAEQMCAGCSREEWTKDEPFIADAIGRWQVLVCASYEYLAEELDYANNCREFFFEVKPDFSFEWSFAGTISGKTCVNFWEGADPYTWGDNYLCSKDNLNIQWSPAGPINNMRCARIYESANPPEHTWADNYLCVPNDSPIFFSWSSAGKINGMECIQINEPAEPPNYTWEDNWLCY